MESYREISLLLKALQDGVIDPNRLAKMGSNWTPQQKPSLLKYLVEEGLMTPDQFHHLESSVDQAAPASPGNLSTPDARRHEPTALAENGIAERTGTYIQPPQPFPAVHSTVPEHAGTPEAETKFASPRYAIKKLHGQGGLGQVWLAHDQILGRDVALKTMRPNRSGDPVSQARFVREAKITAQLEHPSIVPLHDLIGADPENLSGCCYTMRFVSGTPLSEKIADYHARRLRGEARTMAFATLLDAFRAVCSAVAFAHSKGIIHRDLKGQNVVLGQFGEVILLDWGLGKRIGEADDPIADSPSAAGAGKGGLPLVTAEGVAVGTPAFMAPELAAGRPATTASDIYGLGAILYTILTGRPPVGGGTPEQLMENLREYDPVPPGEIESGAPAALGAICMKAISRNVADRFSSAEELALEVQRWQTDEPTMTHRESKLVRMSRWSRRHRTGVTAAGVLFLSAFAALAIGAGAVWYEKERTDEQRREALRNFDMARDLSNASFDMIEANQILFTTSPKLLNARREILTRTSHAYRKYIEAYPDDPAIRERGSKVYGYTANVHRLNCEISQAEALYADSIAHLEKLIAGNAEKVAYRERLAHSHRDLSQLEVARGRLAQASERIRKALEIDRQLLAQDPSPPHNRSLALSLLAQAGIDMGRGRLAEALAGAEGALEIFRGLHAMRPGPGSNPYDRVCAAMAMNQIAMLKRESGRLGEATPLHRECVDLIKEIMDENPADVARPDLQNLMAKAQLERVRTAMVVRGPQIAPLKAPAGGETDTHVALLKSAILQWELLIPATPGMVPYREHVANALRISGERRLNIEDYKGARKDLEKSRQAFEKLMGEFAEVPAFRAGIGLACIELARLAQIEGDDEKSTELFRSAGESIRYALAETTEVDAYSKAMESIEREIAGK